MRGSPVGEMHTRRQEDDSHTHTSNVGRGFRPWLPLGAAIVAVCLWASAFVAIRFVADSLSPGGLAFGRLMIGSVILGGILYFQPSRQLSRDDMRLLGLAGLLWFGVYNVALNEAERHVDAGTAAMLVNVGPIIVIALAAAFLDERITRLLLLGGAISFTGVILIGMTTTSGETSLKGVVLSLVAALGYAGGLVAQKPVLKRASALQVTWFCCVVGAVSCLPFAPAFLNDLGEASDSSLMVMVYLGVFPTALAFTAWAYALARTSAGRIAATTYLVPPIAVLMSWLLLDETPQSLALVGGVLCLGGVYVARRSPSVSRKSPPT
jgi:drug/metabolite transporter (DMT)-like permease